MFQEAFNTVDLGKVARRGITALFLGTATSALATDSPLPRTHATPQTLEMLGDIADLLPRWSSKTHGRKDVYIITPEDLNGDISQEAAYSLLSTLSGGKTDHVLNTHPGLLADIEDQLQHAGAGAVVREDNNFCIIVSNLASYATTAELITKSSGIPADVLEYIPGTKKDWQKMIYGHESGHCADKNTDLSKGIPSAIQLAREINADQHNVDISVGNKYSDTQRKSFAEMSILLRAIGMIHSPYMGRRHHTAASVVLPGEENAFIENDPRQVLSAFDDASRQLMIKASAHVNDPDTWKNAIRSSLRAMIFSSGGATKEYYFYSPEFSLPEQAGQEGKEIFDDLIRMAQNNSWDEITELYGDRTHIMDDIKYRAGAILASQREDKETFRLFHALAKERLSEIKTGTYEATLLSRYVMGIEMFLPKTIQAVKEHRAATPIPQLQYQFA